MSGELVNILNFLNMAVLASAPLLFATLGEILTEKAGLAALSRGLLRRSRRADRTSSF